MSLNNVIPAWMLDDKNEYYILYTDNSILLFYSRSPKTARQFVHNEGDHVLEWGHSSGLFKDQLEKARHSRYVLKEERYRGRCRE